MQNDREPDEIIELEITDVLDLHSFPPGETASVVESYLEEVAERGFTTVRIIHGRGIGAQRRTIRSALSRHPRVRSFADAPAEGGGWGATVVNLRIHPQPDDA
jgi:dsDNA-specific endonuclease/ATPase MutS2